MDDCFFPGGPYTVVKAMVHKPSPEHSGGDLASTWVAKLRVHAEGQITS